MTKPIVSRWADTPGQSLVEHTLLLAFLAIAFLVFSVAFSKPPTGHSSAAIGHLVDVSAVLD